MNQTNNDEGGNRKHHQQSFIKSPKSVSSSDTFVLSYAQCRQRRENLSSLKASKNVLSKHSFTCSSFMRINLQCMIKIYKSYKTHT